MPYNYLVWTFAAQKGNESVAKIGATNKTIQERMKAYKNGILLSCWYVSMPFDVEKKLKKKFNKKFKQRSDYGFEYFEGDFSAMRNLFNRIVKKYESVPGIENCNNSSDFFRIYITKTNSKKDFITVKDLYANYNSWEMNNNYECSKKKEIKALFELFYDVKCSKNIGSKKTLGWKGFCLKNDNIIKNEGLRDL